MAFGKTIELFLVDGTADSIIEAELSNWNGKSAKIPRMEISACGEEFSLPGVYFLFGKDEDGNDAVYIGESEIVKDRLMQHLSEDYWTTAVVFTSSNLDKADIRYLEYRLVEIAKECKRYKVLTKNTYSNTAVKKSKIATLEEFIYNIKIIINTLGYKVLEPIRTDNNEQMFYLSSKTANATGIATAEGFVVLKGATINQKTSVNSFTVNFVEFRKKLMESDKVKDLTTTEDILFSSSSQAADFVLGHSVSGPQTWKTEEGKTLKEIEDNTSK